MEKTIEVIKYLDIFGTKFNFYSDKKKIYYTTLGGIFSILTISICLVTFFFLVKDDIQRISPDKLFISDIPHKENKIIIKDEKLFIPWRIINKKNQVLDNNELIYPIITYYYSEKNLMNETIQKSKIIEYKLCNETMMTNSLNRISLGVRLNELYCIDNTDIELFASTIISYINYINIDFYINKNKTNNISNFMEIEIYYPEILFEPTNLKNPITINYKQYSYNVNKYSTKINKLFLQKNILSDDKGWFKKSITEYYYWTVTKIIENIYFSFEDDKIYTVNINIESNDKKYIRSYKKIYSIISQGFPIILLVFIIIKRIAIMIKTTEENKKLVEFLFENLKEKNSKFKESLNHKTSEINYKCTKSKKSLNEYVNRQTKKQSVFSKFRQKTNDNNNLKNVSQNKFEVSSKNIRMPHQNDDMSFLRNNNNTNSIILNYTKSNQDDNKFKSKLIYSNSPHLFCRKLPGLHNNLDDNYIKYNDIISKNNIKYVSDKLFPFRYYLYFIFYKSIDISKNKLCLPKKFVKANLFLGQLLDISTYLLLQREFNVLKNTFLTREEIDIIERNNKINIGSQTFIRKVNECIEFQKFDIFDCRK